MHFMHRQTVSILLTTLYLIVFICDRNNCDGLQCYVGIGSKHTNGSRLLNSTCSVALNASQSPTSGSTDGESTPKCIIFYNPLADKAEFACDTENICRYVQGAETNTMCYKETRGSLYCCQGDLCNLERYLYRLSPPQSGTLCYSGTNNGSVNITEKNCPTSWCYREIVRNSRGEIVNEVHGCHSRCKSPDVLSSASFCKEVALPNGFNSRTCYCDTDHCNSKISVIENHDQTVSQSSSTVPFLSMNNPMFDHETSSRSWMRIIFPLLAVIMAALLLILIAVVVSKYREHRAKVLAFTYTQLTADLAEEPVVNDDDRLLIG